jgi:alanyl-tRNA synthetase
MTGRLYHQDAYLTEFRAEVVEISADGRRVYLDRTAFYPTSGGQPNDLGTIDGAAVLDVIDEEDRIAHLVATPVGGGAITGRIDWPRRFDHMQQHSGQHLLSWALIDVCNAHTVSFHLGQDVSTIELAVPALDAASIAAAERRANELVFENRPVTISYEDAAGAAAGLRAPTERTGELRIVTIRDCDRSACGGTHVRSTGEIGPILIRRLEKIRGNVRLEFLCGMRALRRARADFEALAQISRTLAAPADETPKLVMSAVERLGHTEKALGKLKAEMAAIRGRELYGAAQPDASGVRRHFQRLAAGAFDEELRAKAQGFTSAERAVFVTAIDDPPSLLLAVSKDAGLHAGNLVKEAVTANGGRGGGSATLAQGSLPDGAALERALERLRPLCGGPSGS